MPSKLQKVIVEIRFQKDKNPDELLDFCSKIEIQSLKLDREYLPVLLSPPSNQVALLCENSGDEIYAIRGTIDEKDISKLKSQVNVINVWSDAKIKQCEQEEYQSLEKEVTDLLNQQDFEKSPIDCNHNVPKGSINQVVQLLGVNQLWSKGLRGQGIVIGVVDSGIRASSRVQNGEIPRVIDGWPKDWGTKSQYSHGNMIAKNVLSIAPMAKLLDMRITSGLAFGMVSDALKAYRWIIDKYKKYGKPQILNNSWSLYKPTDHLDYAKNKNHIFTRTVAEAIDVGIIVLFAAGNCGRPCPFDQCGNYTGKNKSIWGANGYSKVITVGAANIRGQLMGYSSHGSSSLDKFKPDFCSLSNFKNYRKLVDKGTSTACAITSGVTALLKQARPTINQRQAKELFKRTSKNIGPPGWDIYSGSGIIQAKAAYDLMIQ